MKCSLIFSLIFLLTTAAAELNTDQKHRCEQYTSIFENDTTELQYGYCENIHDGRGYTSGRAGFCTGTGDAIEVIKKYTAHVPHNSLAKYIPELERLARHQSGDVSKLNGYCQAWTKAAKDQIFKQCQDAVSDELYYWPAMNEAYKVGVQTVLGQCAFYDTIIQHGGGTDPHSLHSLIKKTEKEMGGKININEYHWILKFLEIRKKDLKQHWHVTIADRVDAMETLIKDNNWAMNPPMHIKTPYHDLIIN